MMRSLFSGVSGLKSHQTRMDVIGNNIANVNTTGFKSSRTIFADMISQNLNGAAAPNITRGGINPKQIGLGTSVSSIDLLFTDGSPQSTGKNTDLALTGNGLFIVKSGNQTYYTRDGAFEFDGLGNYVLPGSGYKVQGWMATEGNINTSSAIGDITIPAGKGMPPNATTAIQYINNLNASIPVITGITDGTTTERDAPTNRGATVEKPLTLTMSDGSTIIETTGTYSVGESIPLTTTATIYDSLGNTHDIPIYFKKVASAESPMTVHNTTSGKIESYVEEFDTWYVSLDINGRVAGEKSTYMHLEDDGTMTEASMTVVRLQFTNTGQYYNPLSSSGITNLVFSNGAIGTDGTYSYSQESGVSVQGSKQTVSIDFINLTQYSSSNTIVGTPNGNSAGTLKSVQFDSSGIITGIYTNGVRQYEAQIAVAQFTNPSGLAKVGSSMYETTNNSGVANVKTAIDLGVEVTPSALEMSNVDVANEFADMIITQRGFQSNSKIITVGDEMLETVINMKR